MEQALREWSLASAAARPLLQRVGFIGSYARGDWGVGSDLDVVLVVESSDKPRTRRGVDWDARGIPVAVDFFVLTREEWEVLNRDTSRFARTVRAEAVWVYERSADG